MRHLRLANMGRLNVVSRKNESEVCLLDYSSCRESDVCWLADMDNGCDTNDSCLIDIT